MLDWPLLSLLILLPLVGGGLLLLLPGQGKQFENNAKWLALVTSLVTFALSIVVYMHFDGTSAAFQFVEHTPWFQGGKIGYHLGVDGLSIFFILLTTLLTPICILVSWEAIEKRLREYLFAFLLLESFIIGVFCALDFLLFYLFFEGMLIPMFLIIGIWGGDRRIYAAFKFFLYTLLGSVLLLVALLYVYNRAGTTSIPELVTVLPGFEPEVQKWLWLALFASFAVKVPMWPFHTWLPDAHVQAPTAGSVILAGILLKMGGYGFLRFSLPMLPDASVYFADFVFLLSVVAVIATSLIALMQEDMKKLIAYSSVAHMGIVTIGLFAFNPQGISGSIMQMISHGLVSGALFMCVGVVYDRLHTREIARFGGLVQRMPLYAFIFMVFTMASVGLPGTSGFVGEILVLVGVYKVSSWVTAGAATGMILGAGYMLWLYRRVVFGELIRADLKQMTDLNKREVISFLPLLVLTVILGVYPNPVLKVLEPSVQKLVGQVQGTNAVVPAPVQEDTVIILPEPGEEVLAPAPTAPAPSDVTAPAVPGEQPVTVPADAASANAPAEADAEVAKEALEDTTEKEQVPPAELPKNQNSKESE